MQLEKDINKAEQALLKLYDRQLKYDSLGYDKSGKAYASLAYDIKIAEEELERLEKAKKRLTADESKVEIGENDKAIAKLREDLANLQKQYESLKASIGSGKGDTGKSDKSKTISKKTLKGLSSGFTSFKKSASNAFASASDGAKNSLKKILAYGFGIRTLFRLFNRLRGYALDAFREMAKQFPEINKPLSEIKNSFTQAKNSIATGLQPIITALAPQIVKIIDLFSRAMETVGAFFATLTGQKIIYKAAKANESFADSQNKVAKSTKEANKQLADYDKLQVISTDNNDDTGSGTVSGTSFELEEVDATSQVSEFAKSLREAWGNADFTGIGEIVGDKINDIFNNIKNYVSWDNIGSTVEGYIDNFAETFNSLIDTIDWKLIGSTFSEGINTLINTIYLLTTEIDWSALAGGIATGLSSAITGIDWAKLGTTLSTQCRVLLQSIRSAIQNFNWLEIGNCVATGINNIDWVGILSDLAGAISDILKAALDLLIGFSDNLDWDKLGRDLWNGLIGVIQNIDWGGIISKAFHLLGSALGGLTSTIVGFCQAVWDTLKKGFESTKDYFDKYIEEAGGSIFLGMWDGIKAAFKNAGTWIKDTIFTPFIEGFKKAFKINSPSKVMEEMGGYIIDGLWNGIKNAWSKITEFFSKKLEGIKNTISEWRTDLIEWWKSKKTSLNLSTTISGWKTSIKDKWKEIKDWWSSSDHIVALKTTISDAKNSLKTKWDDIKKWWNGSEHNVGLKINIATKWADFKETLKKWINNAIDFLNKNLIGKINSKLRVTIPENKATEFLGVSGVHQIATLPNIPKLAKGTYIPANYGDFLAVLGDNKREPEIVSPISAMKKAVAEVLSAFMGQSGNKQPIYLYLDGKQIASVVWDETEKRYKQTGKAFSY